MLNGNRTKSGRKRSPRDFYETPLELAVASIRAFEDDEHVSRKFLSRWLDAGCGTGIWGIAAGSCIYDFHLSGIDISPKLNPSSAPFYSRTLNFSFLSFEDDFGFDVVFGNPPYSLAEEFVRHAYDMIGFNDYIFFLLRLSFLEGIKRSRGLFKELPLKRVYICSRRPSFYSSDGGKHTTDTLSYGMFLWQRGYTEEPTIKFLDWDYTDGK